MATGAREEARVRDCRGSDLGNGDPAPSPRDRLSTLERATLHGGCTTGGSPVDCGRMVLHARAGCRVRCWGITRPPGDCGTYGSAHGATPGRRHTNDAGAGVGVAGIPSRPTGR